MWLCTPLNVGNLSIERNYEKDDDKQSMKKIFELWHQLFGDTELISKNLIKRLTTPTNFMADNEQDKLTELLLDAFTDVLDGQLDTKKLGRWLEKSCDRVSGGFSLVKATKKRDGCVQWKVIKV
jgi:hypothetical protein